MIDLFKEILLSVTIVSVINVIILQIIGENNSQREIAKIGCGLIMIIAVIAPIKGGLDFSDVSFDDIYKDYEEKSQEAFLSYNEIEQVVVKENLQKLVFDQTGFECEISLSEDYEIESIKAPQDANTDEICEVLGISQYEIEYIESR